MDNFESNVSPEMKRPKADRSAILLPCFRLFRRERREIFRVFVFSFDFHPISLCIIHHQPFWISIRTQKQFSNFVTKEKNKKKKKKWRCAVDRCTCCSIPPSSLSTSDDQCHTPKVFTRRMYSLYVRFLVFIFYFFFPTRHTYVRSSREIN